MKIIADGREAPEEFYDRPEIHAHNRFYWEAFFDLSTERQIGMAVGPIPHSAIRAYAADFAISGDRLDSFQRIIRAMDTEYLTLLSPKDRGKLVADTVSADDPEGVRRLFKRLQTRQQNVAPKSRKN